VKSQTWHLEDHAIRHVYIRPRTPHLNGKVERSHRVDEQESRRTRGKWQRGRADLPVNAQQRALALLALNAALALSGCATPARPENMMPTVAPATHHSDRDVSVVVSGGSGTSSTHSSQIANEDFARALSDALEKAGVFSKVSSAAGYYKLSAYIGKVDQPSMGFSMTVTVEVSYTLINTSSGQPVWTKNVTSVHTIAAGESFLGTERLRLATEGAAKDNIQQAVAALEAQQL
jgi:hypothetical protein